MDVHSPAPVDIKCGEKTISNQGCKSAVKIKSRNAATMLEVLVAMAIIMMWMAIMIPILGRARRDTRMLQTMDNQRKIVIGLTCFASDNHGRYPTSVATIGSGNRWNWQEPTMMTTPCKRDTLLNRSMSSYLRSYIEDAGIMFCPNAPNKYQHLQQAWDAGDTWDNADTPHPLDPVIGTYCFYWNYIGCLEQRKNLFKGPHNSSGGHEQSKLLVSDYFGYGHWRSPDAYGSCEKFKAASVTPGTQVSSDFWSFYPPDEKAGLDTIELKLHAAYTDGHVERYSPSETIPMRVSITSDGSVPYPGEPGPGIFYLPQNALY
ncbi:MAG: hypothetical protein ACYS1A_02465 [Planctomycetota bacterium]|jgi:type II secretory pathway pseudopilin PulG